MNDDLTTARPDDGADPLDDLATAIVDGTATPTERAGAGQPAVAERVAAHRRVAERLAVGPPPPTDARREQSIAAALAAFDGAVVGAGPDPAPDRADRADQQAVTALHGRRVNRSTQRRWLAAAAAVAAVAIAIPALSSTGDDDDRETAADAAASAEDSAAEADADAAPDDEGEAATALEAAPGAGGDGAESGGATTQGDDEADPSPDTTAAESPSPSGVGERPIVDLGRFGDLDGLVAAATAALAADDDPTTTARTVEESTPLADTVANCAATASAAEPTVTVDVRAVARLAERPVVVLVVDRSTQARVIVYEADDCVVVVDQAL